RLQEQEHAVLDSIELHLRVPLEKEIPEMEKEIKNVFRNGNQDEVLSEAFRLTITRKDIQTLNHLNWLNDEVILHLLYMQIVSKY
ncbi:hypothetical protein U0070_017137, partial [Myodes glareolus]